MRMFGEVQVSEVSEVSEVSKVLGQNAETSQYLGVAFSRF
jgi:hypothetical protein